MEEIQRPVSTEDKSREEIMTVTNEIDDIISFLTSNDTIIFKSQQRGEPDLTSTEKASIAYSIYDKSKLNFLMRFGKYLKFSHLQHFKQYTKNEEPDGSEVDVILKDLLRTASKSQQTDVRNRRYEALKNLIKEDKYFSEIEMMKRNPWLYEQLVGQYLTEEEKKERDKYDMDQDVTFVKILMEGIERDNAEATRKTLEEQLNTHMDYDDSEEESSSGDEEDRKFADPKPSTSMWGEFEEGKTTRARTTAKNKRSKAITAEERDLLRDEFVSTMYEDFLNGKDEDFDYESIDNDTALSNIEEKEHDEEDKYFAGDDSEENRSGGGQQSSEDELDMYMNALNPHPAVSELAKDINKTL